METTRVMTYGLVVPPFVWAVQLDLKYGLASRACFPDGAPRASFPSGWERIWVVPLVVNLVCAAICANGVAASGQSWRHLRDPGRSHCRTRTAHRPIGKRTRLNDVCREPL